jgi:hypothetical protein
MCFENPDASELLTNTCRFGTAEVRLTRDESGPHVGRFETTGRLLRWICCDCLEVLITETQDPPSYNAFLATHQRSRAPVLTSTRRVDDVDLFWAAPVN